MEFYTKLKSIYEKRGTSISALLKKCGYSKSYGTNWRKGVTPTYRFPLSIILCINNSIIIPKSQ